jgi:hypothetical protein
MFGIGMCCQTRQGNVETNSTINYIPAYLMLKLYFPSKGEVA